jgi:hypothetical protein
MEQTELEITTSGLSLLGTSRNYFQYYEKESRFTILESNASARIVSNLTQNPTVIQKR